MALHLSMGGHGRMGREHWDVSCHGNQHVTIATSKMCFRWPYNCLFTQSHWHSIFTLTFCSCDRNLNPLTRAPREGQGPSSSYSYMLSRWITSVVLVTTCVFLHRGSWTQNEDIRHFACVLFKVKRAEQSASGIPIAMFALESRRACVSLSFPFAKAFNLLRPYLKQSERSVRELKFHWKSPLVLETQAWPLTEVPRVPLLGSDFVW